MGRLGIFAVAAFTLVLGAWFGGAFQPASDQAAVRNAAPTARGPAPEMPPPRPSPSAAALPNGAPALPQSAASRPDPAPESTPLRESALPDAAATPSPASPVTPPAVVAARPEAAPPRAEPASSAQAAAARAEPARPRQEPPRFDVARVGARGALVTAGRAAPGAEVVLLENGREIGRGRADARGEWVILPEAPLSPGARELTLAARLPGGEPLVGEASVVLVVPEPPAPVLAEAGTRPATPAERPEASPTPLALLLPAPGATTPIRVLQAPAAARLSIDLVDYAGASGMRFAGAAPAGAQLRLYIDGTPSGEVVADAQGRWSHSPQIQPAFGRHMLRADQLGAQGQVVSRVEQAFQRDAPPAAASTEEAPSRHVVQPGHNLWRIARGTYGQGIHYTHIFAANREQIRNPHLIYPGQVFTLPPGSP